MPSKVDPRLQPGPGAQRVTSERGRAGTPAALDASLYREMAEASPHGLLIHRDYRPIFANRALLRLLGFESAHALSAAGTLLPRFATEERDRVLEHARAALAGRGGAEPMDATLHGADDDPIIVRLHAHRIDWRGLSAVMETLTDVTELYRAKQKIEDRNARMRLAQRQAKLTYWRWSFEEARLTHWSEDWEGIMGQPMDAATLDYPGMLSHVHPDDREYVLSKYAAADQARRGFSIGFRVVREDGEVRHVRETAEIEFDDNGRAVAHIGFVQDVDDARRTEIKLLESEARYRAFVDNSSEGVWRVQLRPAMAVARAPDEQVEWILANARFAECNDVMARMHGYTDASRIVGCQLRDVLSINMPATRELLRQLVDQGYRLERQRSAEHTADGALRFFDNQLAGVPENGLLTTLWGTKADVTDLVCAERALRASEQRFRDFAETAADWFWETDAEGGLMFISEEFEARSGLRAADLLRAADGSPALLAAPWSRRLGNAGDPHPVDDAEVEYTDITGQRRIARISAKPLVGRADVFMGYRGSGIDITAASVLSERLVYQAAHDSLTGLVGRREFERRLARLLDATRETDAEHALCYVDLDRFKIVNDTSGHVAGDELLRRLGALLKQHARQRDTLARLGGDEFALLLEHCGLDAARRVANDLREAVAGFRFAWEDKVFRLGASIGLVSLDAASGTASDVLRAVDAACYAAKDEGRNRVHVHRDDDHKLALRVGELQWIERINRALEDDGFVLHAQPIVSARPSGDPSGSSEMLLRMVGDDGELVLPGAFLPAAERYGLAPAIDRWVVNAAFGWISRRPSPTRHSAMHFINLSGQSLCDNEFLGFVTQCAAIHQAPLVRVCFEITETAAIANLASATAFIDALSAQGCQFALDDFGSGLSSFAYLKNLPVDFLKIDGGFVRDLLSNPIDLEMVKSINDIGHVMGKRTIAESVESAATLALLADIGVDFAQGFGIAMPMPLDD